MLDFAIVDMDGTTFRCVLGGDIYFDFRIKQFELFGYEHFFSQVREQVGAPLFDVRTNKEVGEVVSVRYLKPDDEVWILVRNGIRGEIYVKNLGE